MVSFKKMHLTQKIVLPVGAMMILCLGTLAWFIQSRSSEVVREVATQEVQALAGQYANSVKNFIEIGLDKSEAMADVLKFSVTDGAGLTREQAMTLFKGLLEEPLFTSAGTAWEPGAFDGKDADFADTPLYRQGKGRFGAYALRESGGISIQPLETDQAFYTEPKRRGKTFVTEPYVYDLNGRKTLLVTISAPIEIRGAFKGMTCVDISLASISTMISAVKVYQTGYGVLLSQTGQFVGHRDASLIGKNFFDMLDPAKAGTIRAAMREGKPYLETRAIKGREYLCAYELVSLEGTDQCWYLLVTAPLDEVLASAAGLSRLTMILCGAALLLVLAVIVIVARATARPITRLADVAQKIAAGKLDTPVESDGQGGEVGRLTQSLKTMIASLLRSLSEAESMKADAQREAANAQEAMKKAEAAGEEARSKSAAMLKAADRLEEVADIVSSASSELSAQIEQSEHGASEQAARVSETATAMEEMNSTVLEVAKNAGSASEVSARTRLKADTGAEVVRQAVRSIRTVQQQSVALREDMTVLREHAQSINRIMGVISDIADQTNLLALNAAIEAARAGEAGRGFAVVADEVRKLAEKTMASTNDVGNAINAIQQSTEKSVQQVDLSVKTIEEATKLANRSGEVLTEIVGMVDDTADQVRAIATASEQQSASSEEINQSINQVNTIAEQTAQAMAESARAVSDLNGQAQVLAGLIQEMKQS